MPALGRCNRGIHPARAAAHDNDLFRRGCGRIVKALQLMSHHRIEGTAEGAVGQVVVKAGKAAAAAGDILFPPGKRLFREIGIADRLAGDFDDIRLTGRDDLLHHIRVIEAAKRGHRCFDVLFDFRRQIDIASVLDKHRRMGQDKYVRVFMDAGGNMDNVHLAVDCLRHGDAFVQTVAILCQLSAAHAELDREILAHRFAHLFNDQQREPHPVLQASAPAVGAVVHGGRHKLPEQPSMAAVDEHHIKPRLLDQSGRAAKGLGSVHDLLLGHAAHRQAVRVYLIVGAQSIPFRCLPVSAGVGIFAAVRQLHDRIAAMAVHGFGRFLERGKRADIVKRDLLGVRAAHRIHNAEADRNAGQAAPRPVLMERDILFAHMAVRIHLRIGHRCAEDPVFEGKPLDGDRACQVGIKFVLHTITLIVKACLPRRPDSGADSGKSVLRHPPQNRFSVPV